MCWENEHVVYDEQLGGRDEFVSVLFTGVA